MNPNAARLALLFAAFHFFDAGFGRTDAATIVVPNELATVEGPGGMAEPFWHTYPDPSRTLRFQQVYAASAFTALPPEGGLITHIAFRPNRADPNFPGIAFDRTLPSIQINLSVTSAGPDSLSGTFNENVGADDMVVFPRGPLVVSSAGPGVAGPAMFDIVIPLRNPFPYDPRRGNLLLDVRNYSWFPNSTGALDAVGIAGDAVGSASDAYVATPGPRFGPATAGVVTQFTTTTIPEPTALSLCLWVGAAYLCRRGSYLGSRLKHFGRGDQR